MKINIADLFCGAGGTSTGAVEAIEALGYTPSLTAINHWPVAVRTHEANHPGARHLCASLDSINPRDLFKEGELDVLWASPECTHHSTARGGKPINDQSRATAWCVTRWAEALRPDHILVENVPEFISWGAIGTNGRPLASKKGATFIAWIGTLESLGYKVDWRVLCAADYGDPTTRRRLFVQAVRGRRKIVWPEPTHAPKEESDLFNTRLPWVSARQIIDWELPSQSVFSRQRPLAAKTMERIWEGLMKYGIKPSLIAMEHGGRLLDVDKPMPTVTTAKGGAIGVANPYLVELRGTSSSRPITKPIGAVTASGTHYGVAQPFLINCAHAGKRRPLSVDEPLPTVAGNRGDVAICEPHLLPQHSGAISRPVSQPCPTVTCDGAVGLVEPFLLAYYGNATVTPVSEPTPTVTCKERFGLVNPMITVDGKKFLLDIRFRMLQPHELAAAQGFRHDYKFAGTKTEIVKQIGNAVPRRLARALVLSALKQTSNISDIIKENAA